MNIFKKFAEINIYSRIVLGFLSGLLLLIVVLSSYCYVVELQLEPVATLILCIIGIGLMYGLSLGAIALHKRSRWLFIICLMVSSGVVFYIWNTYAQTKPVSDYEIIYQGAKQIVDGSFPIRSFNPSDYFYYYNHQIGHAVIWAGLIKLFGENLVAFKIMEALFMIVAGVLIYLVCGKKTGSYEIGAVASTLYMFFIANILGSSIINNQHVSAIMLLTACYFVLFDKWWSYLLSGVFIAFANFARPLGIVIVPAFVIFIVYRVLTELKIKKHVLNSSLLVLAYVLTLFIQNTILIKSGVTPISMSSSPIPYFKFVIGLGSGANKEITNAPYMLQKMNYDYDEYNKLVLETLENRVLHQTGDVVAFVSSKMYAFLSRVDNQVAYAISEEKLKSFNIYLIRNIGQIQYIFLIFLSLLLMLRDFRRKVDNIDVFYIIFILLVAAHVFIEIQERYRYELYICINIWGAMYIYHLMRESFAKWRLFYEKKQFDKIEENKVN